MMRDRFIDDLNRLETLNFDMFRMGEQSLSLLCQLLTNRDASLDNKIAAYEGAMDEKKRQIESLALALILREQPVAQDLALLLYRVDIDFIGRLVSFKNPADSLALEAFFNILFQAHIDPEVLVVFSPANFMGRQEVEG